MSTTDRRGRLVRATIIAAVGAGAILVGLGVPPPGCAGADRLPKHAVQDNRMDELQLMLKQTQSKRDLTIALCMAASHARKDMVLPLIAAGAEVSGRCEYGGTPLKALVDDGQGIFDPEDRNAILKMLLDNHATMGNEEDKSFDVLAGLGAQYGNVWLLETLNARGLFDLKKSTVSLCIAVHNSGSFHVLKLLLDLGLDPRQLCGKDLEGSEMAFDYLIYEFDKDSDNQGAMLDMYISALLARAQGANLELLTAAKKKKLDPKTMKKIEALVSFAMNVQFMASREVTPGYCGEVDPNRLEEYFARQRLCLSISYWEAYPLLRQIELGTEKVTGAYNKALAIVTEQRQSKYFNALAVGAMKEVAAVLNQVKASKPVDDDPLAKAVSYLDAKDLEGDCRQLWYLFNIEKPEDNCKYIEYTAGSAGSAYKMVVPSAWEYGMTTHNPADRMIDVLRSRYCDDH